MTLPFNYFYFTQVNVSLWRNMKEMGFNGVIALSALKRTNNDVNAALQLVNDMDFITQVVSSTDLPAASTNRSSSEDPGTSGTSSNDPSSNTGSSASSSAPQPSVLGDYELARTLAQLEDHLLAETVSEERLTAEEIERSQKAYDVLSKDVTSESDYIDLTLSAEKSFINRYKELLRM